MYEEVNVNPVGQLRPSVCSPHSGLKVFEIFADEGFGFISQQFESPAGHNLPNYSLAATVDV